MSAPPAEAGAGHLVGITRQKLGVLCAAGAVGAAVALAAYLKKDPKAPKPEPRQEAEQEATVASPSSAELSWCDEVEQEERLDGHPKSDPEERNDIKMAATEATSGGSAANFDQSKLTDKLEQMKLCSEREGAQVHSSVVSPPLSAIKKSESSQKVAADSGPEGNCSKDPRSPAGRTSEGRKDSGVASPTTTVAVAKPEEVVFSAPQSAASNGSGDSGRGSVDGERRRAAEVEEVVRQCEGEVMLYAFKVPAHLCGKLIGASGITIQKLKKDSKCEILLQEEPHHPEQQGRGKRRPHKGRGGHHSVADADALQTCEITGTASAINKCLDLIREKFPQSAHPDLTLEQTNLPSSLQYFGSAALTPYNGLTESMEEREVTVSAYETPSTCNSCLMFDGRAMTLVARDAAYPFQNTKGHLFLQQPHHPTFAQFSELCNLMRSLYTSHDAPGVPLPPQQGLICVANIYNEWCRVAVASQAAPDASTVWVRSLDYGGYFEVAFNELRQIRQDYLNLAFQATECFLSNVQLIEDASGSTAQAMAILQELLCNKPIKAMVIGMSDCLPMVSLFYTDPETQQLVSINRELVERRAATWYEVDNNYQPTTADAFVDSAAAV